MKRVAHNPDEIIAIVNENDGIIGKATRKEAHARGLLHRESYTYLINSKKQVLLHKRLDNHLWDHSSAGHFPVEQDYREGALREFEEELGIKLKSNELNEIAKERRITTKKDRKNDRFFKLFLVKKNIPFKNFKIDKEEVEEIHYFDINKLKKLLSSPGKMAGSAKYLIEKYILKDL